MTDLLGETRNLLLQEIKNLSNRDINGKPAANQWSIAQICHHLYLVELSTIKAIEWGLKKDYPAKERINVERVLLDRTKKSKAPPIVEPENRDFEVQEVINMLNSSRQQLLNLLNTIEDKSILKERSAKHAALGVLPLDQWIDFVYLHEQRHIEQIKEVKQAIGLE